MPEVSVVLPTRDRPSSVVRAVRSVLTQSFSDLELVVVDDGSLAASESLAEVRDDRLRILRTNGVGPARARNRALASASGRWIAFQDDDDEWLPGKLAAQMERARAADERVAVVYTAFWRVAADGRRFAGARRVDRPGGDVLPDLLRGNFIALPAALVRADALRDVGPFDPELPCFEDWELFLRLAERFRFDRVDRPLLLAHDSPVSVNKASSETQARAFRSILDKHREAVERDDTVHAEFLLHIGHHLCVGGDLRGGREHLRRALRRRPSLRAAAALFATALGRRGYRALARLRRGSRRSPGGRAASAPSAASARSYQSR